MKIYNELPHYDSSKANATLKNCILTIGNFDGVHIGHRALMLHAIALAKQLKTKFVVLTFQNHPSEVLRPEQPTPLLCSVSHKLMLLEELHVDETILLPFTKEFSEYTAEEFLSELLKTIPFGTLLLGSDAHIGRGREGDPTKIRVLSKQLGFTVEYFPDYVLNGERVSSSAIRECIRSGDFAKAERLLGRPYSICGTVLKGAGRGAPLGFPTANVSVDKLCLPPLGVYSVTLWHRGVPHKGVANLGKAPTLHEERSLILETHVFDKTFDFYNEVVDVQFHRFIRPEKRFDSVEDLQAQIKRDITEALL